MNSRTLPFSRRKIDWILVGFFVLNFTFITYTVDVEQLILPNPYTYQQPLWPPAPMLNLIHAYGQNLDPLLMARPVWWKMTIWLDVLFYGPFYACAIYAFIKGRDWIRIPALVYSGSMFAGVFIILGEEIAGPNATPHLPIVLLLNLPWLLMPALIVFRMAREHPFAVLEKRPAGALQYERSAAD